MTREDYYLDLSMTYETLVDHLRIENGCVKYDYFEDHSCTIKNKKNFKARKGLYMHHIDEDKELLLSEPAVAITKPFDFQKKERLIYCNLVEHLILHLRISVNKSTPKHRNYTEKTLILLFTPGVWELIAQGIPALMKNGISSNKTDHIQTVYIRRYKEDYMNIIGLMIIHASMYLDPTKYSDPIPVAKESILNIICANNASLREKFETLNFEALSLFYNENFIPCISPQEKWSVNSIIKSEAFKMNKSK